MERMQLWVKVLKKLVEFCWKAGNEESVVRDWKKKKGINWKIKRIRRTRKKGREGEKELWREEIRKDRGWEWHWQEKRVGQTFSRLKLASILISVFLFCLLSVYFCHSFFRILFYQHYGGRQCVYCAVIMLLMWCCFPIFLLQLLLLKGNFYCIEQSVVVPILFSSSHTHPTFFSILSHSQPLPPLNHHHAILLLFTIHPYNEYFLKVHRERERAAYYMHPNFTTLHFPIPISTSKVTFSEFFTP